MQNKPRLNYRSRAPIRWTFCNNGSLYQFDPAKIAKSWGDTRACLKDIHIQLVRDIGSPSTFILDELGEVVPVQMS